MTRSYQGTGFDIHEYAAPLYDKLRMKWSKHTDHHTAEEIRNITQMDGTND